MGPRLITRLKGLATAKALKEGERFVRLFRYHYAEIKREKQERQSQ